MKKILIAIITIISMLLTYFIYEFFFVYHINFDDINDLSIGLNQLYIDNGISIKYRGKELKDYEVETNIDSNNVGEYFVKYKVNNKVLAEKLVNVVDDIVPEIKLNGNSIIDIIYPNKYVDEGATASDNYDGDITDKIKVIDNVDYNHIGKYEMTYEASDSSNNISIVKRTINIIDSVPPKIEFKRDINTFTFKDKKIDMSYTATDNYDGDITDKVTVSGNVDFSHVGKYYITYSVSDSSGNKYEIKTSISVQDKKATDIPVLMYHWFYDDTKGEKPGEANAHNFISKTAFENQMKYLSKNNYYFPTWEELEKFIDGKISLPEKSVILTDDDACSNFYKIAYPVSKKYEVPFTSFVITSKKTYYKYLDAEYLDLESHTDNMHARTCHTAWDGKVMCSTYEEIYNDIKTSVDKLNNDVKVFAYPFGHYSDNTIKALKKNNIRLAFTINEGRVKKGDNKYKLPRVRISSWTSLDAFKTLVK